MIDPIIDAKFNKFRKRMNLKDVPDGTAFEQFVNYTILISHQADAFNGDGELLHKVNVGGYGDMGIDGLAIKINGNIVRDIDEAKSLVSKLSKIDIEFIFIQSKYKTEFTKSEFISFTSGVRDFLSEKSQMPHGNEIDDFLQTKEFLLSEDTVYKWNNNPEVRLYYVTMAKEHDSKTQDALAEMFKKDILSLNTYQEPIIYFVNRTGLKEILNSNENIFEQVINFIYSMPLTKVKDVSNSCVLLCYASELKKLLRSPDGLIRKSLFDENVRDFQGRTSINMDINKTIEEEPQKFVLLNNGITIVCDSFISSNLQIKIKNPQIVNGCQTSHVVFTSKDEALEKAPIIIKLISTESSDITNQIVKGTNNQNVVPAEAFETTKPFHQELEKFINALSPEYDRFYYERRSKQYDGNPNIMYYQKIDLRIIIQSFIGMFLNSPHVAHKSEIELLADYSGQIFIGHQSLYPYFTAALAYYELESQFRENILEKKDIYPFKMHLLMIFREIVGGKKVDINDEDAIEQNSKRILGVLKLKDKRTQYFKKATEIFDECRLNWTDQLKKDPYNIKTNRAFTELLLKTIGNYDNEAATSREEDVIYFGKIVHIGIDRHGLYYGHIGNGVDEDVFFHSSRNPNIDFKNMLYKNVSYKVEKDRRSGNMVAKDITVLPDMRRRVVVVVKKSGV
jgi:hypothetical protein